MRILPVAVLVLSLPHFAWGADKPGSTRLPGEAYQITIDGTNTVTFVPQARVEPVQIEFQSRIEYLVNHRMIETTAIANSKNASKKAPVTRKTRGKGATVAASTAKAVSAIDFLLHTTQSKFTQAGKVVTETQVRRDRFRGRIQPDGPFYDVIPSDAPARLKEILAGYDVVAASVSLDEDDKQIDRKFRNDLPSRAILETLISIHTPIPRNLKTWEVPTQLAMGQGQTAKGNLTLELQGDPAETKGLLKVSVKGVLKAEGVVAGRFVKDGTYTVTGEQMFDSESREWKSSKWTVAIENALAAQGGQVVGHAKGEMKTETTIVKESKSDNKPIVAPR
jgi:hypothetical protein